MSDNGERFPDLSVHLSRVLDDIGLNMLTVRRRRETRLFLEEWNMLLNRAIEVKEMEYYFGSQVEGTTTIGLHSDIDVLVSFIDDFNIIQDMSDLQHDKINLLMLQEDTAPGFCRLHMLGPHIPDWLTEDLPNDKCIYDRRHRIILKNNVFPQMERRNGPARSFKLPGARATDIVFAFRCNAWPREAGHWAQKRRHGNWPEQSLIEKAVSTGFFLVPVGYKLSETEDLEWRISLSLTERLLMFSMNMTQLKCYVVLKMIIKSLVIPSVGESISSYHCKTAVFHCIETKDTGFWVEDNLFQCIISCLSLLRRWVRKEYCPHFIIPESNLFAGKINTRNKHKLLSVLEDILESSGQFLFRISTDELGDKLSSRCSAPPTRTSFAVSKDTLDIILNEEISGVKMMNTHKEARLFLHYADFNKNEAIVRARDQLNVLDERYRDAEHYQRQATIVLRETLLCLIGSLEASDSLSDHKGIPDDALSCLLLGAENDITNMLKLASVLFCDGQFATAEKMLQEARSRFKKNGICPACQHAYIDNFPSIMNVIEFGRQLLTQQDGVERQRLFARCVVFSDHELHSAPPALRYELFRSVGDDSRHRSPIFDYWMALVVVDFLPFLYYLQYLTYGLRKPDFQRRALHNLEQCIKDNDKLGHLETAWNLLGQCMEAENNPAAALDCYRKSLVIRPRDNAANWHLAILVYREMTSQRK